MEQIGVISDKTKSTLEEKKDTSLKDLKEENQGKLESNIEEGGENPMDRRLTEFGRPLPPILNRPQQLPQGFQQSPQQQQPLLFQPPFQQPSPLQQLVQPLNNNKDTLSVFNPATETFELKSARKTRS